jgi:hypothetical protein
MDRWSFWPGVASLITVAVLRLLCKIPGSISFLLVPVSLVFYALAATAVLIGTVIYATKKRPRRAASILLVLVIPVLLWRPIDWATDCAHLGLTVGFGAKSSDSGFAAYDWSVGFAGGANTFLIHDVTHQIALPMAQHTQPPRAENGFGEECAGKVRRLLGHYYVCKF